MKKTKTWWVVSVSSVCVAFVVGGLVIKSVFGVSGGYREPPPGVQPGDPMFSTSVLIDNEIGQGGTNEDCFRPGLQGYYIGAISGIILPQFGDVIAYGMIYFDYNWQTAECGNVSEMPICMLLWLPTERQDKRFVKTCYAEGQWRDSYGGEDNSALVYSSSQPRIVQVLLPGLDRAALEGIAE